MGGGWGGWNVRDTAPTVSDEMPTLIANDDASVAVSVNVTGAEGVEVVCTVTTLTVVNTPVLAAL
eukprot:5518488-Prymnesium_polylepis.1